MHNGPHLTIAFLARLPAGTEAERLAVFRRIRDEIEVRVRDWLQENGAA
jgi:hypothetical protein